MPEIKFSPELAARFEAKYETVDAKGMLRLADILKEAATDPDISRSDVASGLLAIIFDGLVSDSIFAKTPSEPFERLLVFVESIKQVERSKKSLQHYRDTEAFTRRQFMEHTGLWDSISAAVIAIEDSVLAYSKSGSRPLAPTNAARQIRLWLSDLLSESEEAKKKLTDAGRARLRRH